MILAAHQPQYLPWLGYFHKMASCDVFVYLDDVQYKKREFQNRNKIRVKDGWQWLTVPVVTKSRYEQEIRSVEIDATADWAKEHWTALTFAYSRAAHFRDYEPALKNLYGRPWRTLAEVSEALIDFQRGVLQINTPLRRSSGFEIRTAKSQRLVDLCRALNADTYLSGAGARDYLDEALFEKSDIRVVYQEFHSPRYPQLYEPFEPYMAALDLIFNCGAESARILGARGRGAGVGGQG